MALLLTLAAGAVAARADPRTDAELRALVAADARVAAIGHRLATANASACADTAPTLGLSLHALGQYDAALRPAMTALVGLGDAPTILAVAPGSPAADAGLAPGDAIVAIAGNEIAGMPLDVGAVAGPSGRYDLVATTRARIDAAARAGPVPLDLARGDRRWTVRVPPVMACATSFELVPSAAAQAHADGRSVSITTTLEAAIEDDAELAVVLAHELAHNARRHRLARARDHVPTRVQEEEADRLAVAIVAAAGFDPAAAARFWTGTGRRLDRGLFGGGGHAGWRARATLSAMAAAALAVR